MEIETHLLADDGLIPNSPLPLVCYRQAADLAPGDAEGAFQTLFRGNLWRGCWVDGIYDWHHYHSTAHEVLGLARGSAKVRFGGPNGIIVDLERGDVVVIPAGVAHCRLDAAAVSVVGAYPRGQDWDMCGANHADRSRALEAIPHVPLPEADPVTGTPAPLIDLWNT